MDKKKDKKALLRAFVRNITLPLIIVINIALLTTTVVFCVVFIRDSNTELRNENIENISNINKSAAEYTSSIVESYGIKLSDLCNSIKYSNLDLRESLDLIYNTNSDTNINFEIIRTSTDTVDGDYYTGTAYTGYITVKLEDGNYQAVTYASENYSDLQISFDDTDDDDFVGKVCLTPEFYSNATLKWNFGTYKHVEISGKLYCVLLYVKTSYIQGLLNTFNDYDGQSTIFVNTKGDYIVKSSFYSNTDFYEFIKAENELTLDEKRVLRDKVTSSNVGELYYSVRKVDYIFYYERFGLDNWYCITCVPLEEFHASNANNNYGIYVSIILIILLLVDVIYFLINNAKLRLSRQKEAEASAAKGNFMSRMSHEIRTPLNAIIGYNTIAKNSVSASENEHDYRQTEMKVMDCLEKSYIASKHLLSIINDVLDMSSIESGKMKLSHDKFDFKGLINSLTTIFYPQARQKGIRFSILLSPQIEEWLVGDQMRVNQILTNLLSNAVKFTQSDGAVSLNVSLNSIDDKTSNIHFEVKDSGIGITDEFLAHMFDPFEQADSSISRRFGGTGLGLSITKKLVDLMGGSITVESKEGEGSTFKVDLSFERTEQPENTGIYDFASINALVVDDDEYTCDYISQLFRRCGARCSFVTSGKDAIAVFKSESNKKDPYNLCLVDWQMPGMDGISTIRELKKLISNEIPIIVITAYDYTEVSEKAKNLGVTMFISKPLFQSTLFDLLVTITTRGSIKKIEKNKSIIFNGETILLAEDNEMNMEIATKLLESANLKVVQAWNGEEAVKKYQTELPGTFSLILMDVHMPIMGGYEATRKIRDLENDDAKTIPILAMTADAFVENINQSKAAGMNDHISKPIDINVLFSTLNKYLK